MSYPLFKYLKKHTWKSENTKDNFSLIHFLNIWNSTLGNLKIPRNIFSLSPFQIFKTVYLQIWKYLGKFFAHTLFKYLKKYIYKSLNNLTKFFAYSTFQIFNRGILANVKIPRRSFCWHTFQIFKIAYLQIWKYLGQFLIIYFSNI